MIDHLGAGQSVRTERRSHYRAGYSSRGRGTRIGKLNLRVPRDRNGEFSIPLFERDARSKKVLVRVLAELYVHGGSKRTVTAITEELSGHGFSASSFSQIKDSRDASLAKSSVRRLQEPYPYLIVDARCEKVRDAGLIELRAVQQAIGIHWEGRRRSLGGQDGESGIGNQLEGLTHQAQGARPDRGRVRRLPRPRRPPEGDPGNVDRGGLAAILRAFPPQCSGLPSRMAEDDCLQELHWNYDRRGIHEANLGLAA